MNRWWRGIRANFGRCLRRRCLQYRERLRNAEAEARLRDRWVTSGGGLTVRSAELRARSLLATMNGGSGAAAAAALHAEAASMDGGVAGGSGAGGAPLPASSAAFESSPYFL